MERSLAELIASQTLMVMVAPIQGLPTITVHNQDIAVRLLANALVQTVDLMTKKGDRP